MEEIFQAEYWIERAESLWLGFIREFIDVRTAYEAVALLLCWLVARFLARRLKPKLTAFIEPHEWKHVRINRLFSALTRMVTPLVGVPLIWFVLTAFTQYGLTTGLLNVAASLLTAWVLIRLTTSVVREENWSKFIAVLAWTVAALHILSLLTPVMNLLDQLAINFGGVHLSVLLIIKALILMAVLLNAAAFAANKIERRLMLLEGLTPSVQVLLAKSLKVLFIGTAVIVSLSGLGIDLSVFAFFGGAIGVGLGFGLQKVVSNLISGIILLMDKSIKPGDVVEVGETYGRIQSLSARYVSVVTRDGVEYLIPNEEWITNPVINWSFSNNLVRLKITVGVSYDSDVHEVIRLMKAAAEKTSRVVASPKPVCQLKNFGDNSIDMELRFWIADPQNGISNVSSNIRIAIWESFKENNIEIPFPQRDLHIKSGDARDEIAQNQQVRSLIRKIGPEN